MDVSNSEQSGIYRDVSTDCDASHLLGRIEDGLAITGVLKDWVIINKFGSICATGYVYDNDRFEPGDHIHTSSIQVFDPDKGLIKTRNSVYKLGRHA